MMVLDISRELTFIGKPCNKNHFPELNASIRYKANKKCIFCNKQDKQERKKYCAIPPLFQQIKTFAQRDYFPDCCIEWWGAFYSNGYGHIGYKDRDYLAHRLSYESFTGKTLSKELVVCHKCDNPSCVNPLHLFEGTKSDNMQDCVSKGRLRKAYTKGEMNPLSILTEENVKEIRSKYKPKKYTIPMLAKEYSVSVSLIAKVVQNRVWTHII